MRQGSRLSGESALHSRTAAAGKGKRKRRKRTVGATTIRRINAKARERQDAWLESGQPNRTYQLTRELDGLYGEHRDDQAGTFTDQYYGRTWRAR